ncbi:hypothetical protein N0V93_002026 [Gnomoniopsis smithogilvyi]|uniref:FAD/NAD(P)-binding domain-containing protein n=1 Tax=Gnomoniopsis smithogilvyi TaxID=1191159 RepID=A0A9W9D2R3_9PEZI|nr:hypothetical protein N0V93_002026 [Gnomoniopsis smithogilvyi]
MGIAEYPPRVELRDIQAQFPLPQPGSVDPALLSNDGPNQVAISTLAALEAALAAGDAKAVAESFFPTQAFWRDLLALTSHIRTFAGHASVVATSLVETTKLRGIKSGFKLSGTAQFIPATPALQFIDFDFTFKTESPAASCRGLAKLLPVKTKSDNGSEVVKWKIWTLSTILDNLDIHPENEALLRNPRKNLEQVSLTTDVVIIGGGNAAVTLAARLKVLGVESIMVERNAKPGDNWKLRYDCMKFHIPTSFCEMPYMTYDKDLQTPHLLTKDELGDQVHKYVETFQLNSINSAKILFTKYDGQTKKWTVNIQTPSGNRSITCKQLVQATGFGSQKPYLPQITDSHVYKGISIHSTQFKSGRELKERGIKTALIVGSANTAFDVLEDCHAAGLQTTMNVRSPTYIIPLSYVCDKMSLGAYDLGVDFADRMFQTGPSAVDTQFAKGLFATFGAKEPERYTALAKAGFPVLDSTNPETDLMSNLLERAGGHYVDTDGTKLLAEGKAGLKALAEPVAFTGNGLKFSDGSTLATDAVIWCTGFSDKCSPSVTAEVLGGGPEAEDIAARLDATWGLDEEGEIRGMWKRHPKVENYYSFGGFTSQHRFYSRITALQIKAALEGILPPAYRDTPRPQA